MIVLVLLAIMLLAVPAQSTTYYISPSGSDSNNGLSTGAPWKTFSKSVASSACGDTIVVMDGTYTFATTGFLSISNRRCTASTPFLVQSQNQRKGYLQGDGLHDTVKVMSSSYIVLDGLRTSQGVDDSAGAGGASANFHVLGTSTSPSDHITIKNVLAQFNNRYQNIALIRFAFTNDSLVEDSEVYSFHRYGVMLSSNTYNNVVRRVYCNSRNRADIPGGYVSGLTATGDSCAINYPNSSTIPANNNIFENIVAENSGGGISIEAVSGPTNDKIYGSISIGNTYGFIARSRGTSASQQPANTLYTDVVCNQTTYCWYWRGNLDTQVTNATSRGSTGSGWLADNNSGLAPPTVSSFGTNVLIFNGASVGTITSQTDWGMTNFDRFNNSGSLSPSSDAHYSPNPPSSTDPQMGTCVVWRPDGSTAKTNNWGADVLYRYQDGVLTTVPLWDPVTGEFPHGALIAGVNDIAGQSLFDFHQRINANTNGCSFPSGYGNTSPTPPTVVMGTYGLSGSSGTNSLSWNHTIDAGQDQLLVCVGLFDSGANVGSVATADVSGQTMSFVKRSVTSPAYRATEMWSVASPTSGLRTVTLTTTGAVTGMLGRSIEFDATSGLNTAGANHGFGSAVSVTVQTNSNELVVDCVASNKDITFSAGIDQTSLGPQAHATQSLSLYVTTQPGSAGGVMDNSLGGSVYWPTTAVSLMAGPPDPPPTATVTLTRYQLFSTYGTESGATAISTINQPATIGPGGEFRLRTELTASGDATSPFGVALYCQKNGGGYSRVTNTTGTHGIRLYGGGIVTDLPASLSNTTQRFTPIGSFITGAVIRDDASTFVASIMSPGDKTELEFVGAATLAVSDTVTCQVRKDDGSPLDVYAVTPTFTAVAPSASFGF